METMHAAVLTAPRRFELRGFPFALGSHPPRVATSLGPSPAGHPPLSPAPLGRIDIHLSQIIAAARKTKPAKWRVLRS